MCTGGVVGNGILINEGLQSIVLCCWCAGRVYGSHVVVPLEHGLRNL